MFNTPLIKDALGPRWLSQMSKIWCVLICRSMESNLSTLWAQWLSLKGQQTLCKVCWSTVILISQRYCHCVQFDEKWAFIGKGEAFHALLSMNNLPLRQLLWPKAEWKKGNIWKAKYLTASKFASEFTILNLDNRQLSIGFKSTIVVSN